MAKLYIAYRFTGEDPKELNSFCSLWKESHFISNKLSNKQILEYSLKEIETSDYIFVFIKSQEKSEGMLLEVGYALAKGKKIILAIKKDIKTVFLREIADKVIELKI